MIGTVEARLRGQHLRERCLKWGKGCIAKMIRMRNHAVIGIHRRGTARTVFQRTHVTAGVTQDGVGRRRKCQRPREADHGSYICAIQRHALKNVHGNADGLAIIGGAQDVETHSNTGFVHADFRENARLGEREIRRPRLVAMHT